jgi:hypothetical protein
VAQAFAGEALDEEALAEAVARGELAVVACPSESSVEDKVAKEIDKLMGEGLRAEEIAIVSLRGWAAEGGMARGCQSASGRRVSGVAPQTSGNDELVT